MIVRIFVTIFLYKIPIQRDFMLTDGIIKEKEKKKKKQQPRILKTNLTVLKKKEKGARV